MEVTKETAWLLFDTETKAAVLKRCKEKDYQSAVKDYSEFITYSSVLPQRVLETQLKEYKARFDYLLEGMRA